MGVDITTKLVKYNPDDNLWHELKLYRMEDGKYEKIYIFNGRNSELFDIMQGKEDDDIGHFPCDDIPLASLDEELRKEINEEKYGYCYDFHEISLSDMEFYLYKHPTITDYDADWENWKIGDPKPQKENPVKWIYDECIAYAEFADGWAFDWTPRSRYKLLYWFDC